MFAFTPTLALTLTLVLIFTLAGTKLQMDAGINSHRERLKQQEGLRDAHGEKRLPDRPG